MYARSELSKLDLIQAKISQQKARGPGSRVETEIKIILFPVNQSWEMSFPEEKVMNCRSLQPVFLSHHHPHSPRNNTQSQGLPEMLMGDIPKPKNALKMCYSI